MDDLTRQYRKSENFVFRRIRHETILVPLREQVGDLNCIYNLNEVGALVWEYLDGSKRLADIRDMICERFEVSPLRAAQDLCEFIAELRALDAISEVRKDP